MTRQGYFARLAISVVIDLLDFTLGRGLMLVPWEEGVGAAVLMVLWGPAGLAYLGELLEPTEQIDAFLPAATLIALGVGLKSGLLLGEGANTARRP